MKSLYNQVSRAHSTFAFKKQNRHGNYNCSQQYYKNANHNHVRPKGWPCKNKRETIYLTLVLSYLTLYYPVKPVIMLKSLFIEA